ncbi:MAG TPA: class I SAM-dependent methyltransferase [Gemmataceae bacterium]|nr:class I SAM-dependent methyltransferase [Gemmataceae bacterium]
MSAQSSWAQSFFTGMFVDLWLQAMGEPHTRLEVDSLEKVLRLPAGAKVLDVACGGGRHCMGLAERGYQLTGLDISTEFLAVARSRAAERQLPITWEQRPMQDLPWQAEFDGAYCVGNSLGGLDDDATAAFFQAVARALKPGGRFAVDNGAIAECLLPTLKERFWVPVGDILFLIQNRYDHVQGRLEMDFTFIREGRVEKKSGFQQVYTYRAFCRMLTEAGFGSVEGYGSAELEAFRLGCRGLFAVATRG